MVSDLYPFKSNYLDLGGIRYHYLDEGPEEAQTVVMLHGNPTWSFYYRDLIKALRDQYRCIVPDHIGMGLSDKPAEAHYDYTLSQRVDDLETLLTHIRRRANLTLVLHDWGGMIGMAYAVRNPHRVKRLVILNTAAFHMPQMMSLPRSLKLSRMPLLGKVLIQGFNLFARGAMQRCALARPLTEEVKEAYLAPYDSWQNRIATHRFVKDIPLKPGDRTWDLVSEVEQKLVLFRDIPSLICWGMKDFVFTRAYLDRWRSVLAKAECHRFVEAGHFVLEDAGDDVRPLVRNFLDTHPLNVTRPAPELE